MKDNTPKIDILRLEALSHIELETSERERVANELKITADYIYPHLLGADTVALPFSCKKRMTLCELREDTLEYTQSSSSILACAPSVSDGYITVPSVMSGKEES